jgi:4-hydroxybenzoate polyprenyltransferase
VTATSGNRLLFLLKASRPGLWFQTIWLYVLPVAAMSHPDPIRFWLGMIFVTFPLNLLVYGWNDLVDEETDRLNPRKDSYLFGARGSKVELAVLPRAIAWVNIPFIVGFTLFGGWRMGLVLIGIVVVTWIYNLPRRGLRGRPPFELLNQLGYLLLLPFSLLLNNAPALPWQSVVYLLLFCTHAHLMGEIMDVEPDRRSGRRTTATVLGVVPVKGIVLAMVLAEAFLIMTIFSDTVLGLFLLFGAAWLVFDIAFFRARSYTHNQFLFFGAALNVAGFASMAWVWYSGTLTRLPVG